MCPKVSRHHPIIHFGWGTASHQTCHNLSVINGMGLGQMVLKCFSDSGACRHISNKWGNITLSRCWRNTVETRFLSQSSHAVSWLYQSETTIWDLLLICDCDFVVVWRYVRIWSSLGLNIWTFRAAFMPYSGSRLVFPWRVNRLAVLAPGTLLFPMQTFGLRWGFLTVHVLLCTRNPHFINYSNPFYIYKTRLKRPYQHVSTCFSGIFFWGTWWPACLFLKL